MTCSAKIRPFPGEVELTCELEGESDHTGHSSTLRDYAYPGSVTTISWHESDRRTFRGEWPGRCSSSCVLPSGHRGGCAQ